LRVGEGSGGRGGSGGSEGGESSALEAMQENWENLVDTQEAQSEREYLYRIVNLCKTDGIELVLYLAPILEFNTYLRPRYPAFEERVSALAEKHELQYVNVMQMPSLNHLHLWKDMIHLNLEGVQQYSYFLANRLLDKQNQETP